MPNRIFFQFTDEVLAADEILDRLARMMWERETVMPADRNLVNDSKNVMLNAMLRAGRDLPQRADIKQMNPPSGTDVEYGGIRKITLERIAALMISRDVGSVLEAFLKATADCWPSPLSDRRSDGSLDTSEDCDWRALRGGSFSDFPLFLRSAARLGFKSVSRAPNIGFRVAVTIE